MSGEDFLKLAGSSTAHQESVILPFPIPLMTPFTNKFFEHSGAVEMSNFKAQVGFAGNNGNYCYVEQSTVTKKGIKTLH